jgi:hypothetical protein
MVVREINLLHLIEGYKGRFGVDVAPLSNVDHLQLLHDTHTGMSFLIRL